MQPAQLSLMPDADPAPPKAGGGRLPDAAVEAATAVLADLIAKAAAARKTAPGE